MSPYVPKSSKTSFATSKQFFCVHYRHTSFAYSCYGSRDVRGFESFEEDALGFSALGPYTLCFFVRGTDGFGDVDLCFDVLGGALLSFTSRYSAHRASRCRFGERSRR